MKPICIQIRSRLSQNNMRNCIWICKYKELNESDYRQIINHGYKAGSLSPQRGVLVAICTEIRYYETLFRV